VGLARLEPSRLDKVPSIGMRSAMLEGHWHFQCPECGMGDFELRHLADDQQLFCEPCLEEEGCLIRLQRWPIEEQTPAYARFRPGLAA
jgi:predicted RNA-binding Zn-ribbon protein involved in translation (DUF1610 family)